MGNTISRGAPPPVRPARRATPAYAPIPAAHLNQAPQPQPSEAQARADASHSHASRSRFLALLNRPASTQSNATIPQRWQAWARSARAEPDYEGRKEAAKRVATSYKDANAKVHRPGSNYTMLHLKTLNLQGDLPPLPNHLIEFDVSGNRGVTSLPAVPPGLKFLSAWGCDLRGLPDFPEDSRLTWLKIGDNPQLQALPRLPAALTKLKAVSCGLRQLPDFPEGSHLSLLFVDGNPELRALPPMPRSLEHLYARNCQLQQLPELHELTRLDQIVVPGNPLEHFPTIPRRVTYVDAARCRLTALPAMPQGVTHADFSNNQISDLSHPAPQSIKTLNLKGNPITEVPDWVFQLSPQAEVQISVGHLSEQARQDLMARATPGRGPLISFDLQDGTVQDLPHEAVAPVAAYHAGSQARNSDPLREWRQWTTDPNTSRSQREQRSIAMERVTRHHPGEDFFLDLSQLSLTGELPALPSYVPFLNISSNPGLRLSSIPPTLRVLRAACCDFEDMPDCSEASQLEQLSLASNPRLSVLRPLPPGLRTLDVSHCGLVQLPEFPAASRLESLTVSGNPLEQLPTLPQNLSSLTASGCRLSALPALSPNLSRVDLSNNSIRSFLQPAIGTTITLRQLNLRGNPITELPDWVFHLRPQAEVEISAGRMSEEARLAVAMRASAGTGPRIVFDLQEEEHLVDMQDPAQAIVDRQGHAHQDRPLPLEAAVAAWLDPSREGRASWRAFGTEEGAPAFADFLNRLGTTNNATNASTRGPFRQGVQQLLNNMAESPALRADCFAICTGATESCQDRVTLSYQSMAVPRLAEAVRRGDFDDNRALPDFIDQARSLYRRDVLTDIATRKAASMRVVDPIEVHLAYQVRLNGPLDLRLDGNQMAYFSMSGLTEADFRVAEREVLHADQGFANHLINHSGPWAQLMQRRAPELYEQMQEAKHAAIEPQRLAPALRAHLAQAGLQNDPDATREAGRLVSDELTLHAQRPFVNQFLRDCQLDPNGLLGVTPTRSVAV